jgi:hypothetical protein
MRYTRIGTYIGYPTLSAPSGPVAFTDIAQVVRTRFGLKALVLAGDRDSVSKWAVALSDSGVLVSDCGAGSTRIGVGIPFTPVPSANTPKYASTRMTRS